MKPIDLQIANLGILPVIKLSHPQRDAAPLADALCTGGLPAAEVTFRAEGADQAIRIMRDTHPEMVVGAGTVLTPAQVDAAHQAGAQFIVSPGFSHKVVVRALQLGLAVYPGCTTPTEYQMGLEYGLEVLKFFPAEQSGGLAKIKSMSAPFPMIRVMPTGGISLKNLREYLSCPAVCACGGTYMVSSQLIDNQDWEKISELCRESVQIVKEVRSNGK